MNLRRSRLAVLLAAALALVPCAEPSAQTTLPSSQEPAKAAPAPPPASLGPLLAKAADYCRRLESSAFDFVCREEIAETIDPNLEIDRRMPPLPSEWNDYIGPTIRISRARKIKSTYVYDYQCVRAGRTIREVRTQLEENGKRKVVPNAELRTSVVVWGTALLAPAGIFAERFQPDYIFTVAGNDRIGATAVVIVDAKPRPGAPASRSLYGKAWIDPVDRRHPEDRVERKPGRALRHLREARPDLQADAAARHPLRIQRREERHPLPQPPLRRGGLPQ